MTTTTQLVPPQTVPDIDPDQLFYVLYSPINQASAFYVLYCGAYAWTAKEIVSLSHEKLSRADYGHVEILRNKLGAVDLYNADYADDAEPLLRQPTFSEEFAAAVYNLHDGGYFAHYTSALDFVMSADQQGLRDNAEDLVARYDHRVKRGTEATA